MPSILTKRFSHKIIFIYSPGFVWEVFKDGTLDTVKKAENSSSPGE
jgi:hypothetical protein